MDISLKSCTTTATQDVCNDGDSNNGRVLLVDRLSSLPDELLILILALLPTKDAATTCFLSKRLRLLLPLLTSLDLDTSFTSHCPKLPLTLTAHCLEFPNKIREFYSFVTFVDTLLQAHRPQHLTRFRLGVGTDLYFKFIHRCDECCFPDVTNIGLWISFPLTCCGLKKLDLRIHVKEPVQLPPEIFTCETLEVLKLDVNLLVDWVLTMTSFHLPNLKVLKLNHSSHLYDGDGGCFLARLVSSCPLLEDLTLLALMGRHAQSIIIPSPSLRILHLQTGTLDSLLINTPNLEYLKFASNLVLQQSVTNMDHLIEADITIHNDWKYGPGEGSFQRVHSFIRSLTNVHHLSLMETCIEDLNFDAIKDQLPIFPNLKYLALGNNKKAYWDKVLETFLKCSPVLETLVFPQGMMDDGDFDKIKLQLEQEWCRTDLEIIPWCCRFHLKRILIENCCGNQREIDLIQFLLKYALVLEELTVYRFTDICPGHRVAGKMEIQKTLRDLPRASVSCSIQVQG